MAAALVANDRRQASLHARAGLGWGLLHVRLEVVTMAGSRSVRTGRQDWRRRPQWWAALAAVAAMAVVAVAGCSGARPAPSVSPSVLPKTTLTPCPVDVTAGAARVGDCGYVWVPQDWAHPGGAKMQLQVVVLPATGTSHPADPLFYLAGFGTAATGSDQISGALQMFGRLNQTMDLVFVDQRGDPGSWPQSCPGLLATGPALRAAVSRCLASVSRNPRHDTTASAVRDLDQARKALGYDQINLAGGSYGVTLGLAYLQRYSAHVRTAVFLSGSLLNAPSWQLAPVHAQQAFDQLAARCAAAPACNRSYHPAADLATIVTQLRAHPARITITGLGGQRQTVTITLDDFLNVVQGDYLDSPDTAVLLPEDLHALARGQWAQVIAERGLASAASAENALLTQLNTITIRCSDAWAAMNPAQMSPASSFPFASLKAAMAAWQQQLCALWPHDPGVSGIVRITVPVVFVNGTADPTDPPANVVTAPRTMPNALLVSVPGGTHNPVSATCLSAQATAFIQAGKPADKASWAACALALGQALPAFPTP